MVLERRRSGFLSHWSHGALVVAAVVWVFAGTFVWWVLGVRLDAADTGRAEPAWITRLDGPALVLALLALLATFVSAGVALHRAHKS